MNAFAVARSYNNWAIVLKIIARPRARPYIYLTKADIFNWKFNVEEAIKMLIEFIQKNLNFSNYKTRKPYVLHRVYLYTHRQFSGCGIGVHKVTEFI